MPIRVYRYRMPLSRESPSNLNVSSHTIDVTGGTYFKFGRIEALVLLYTSLDLVFCKGKGKGALYPLDTALKRPLSTSPDMQNAPSVEQARYLAPPPRATVLGDGNCFVGFLTGPHTKKNDYVYSLLCLYVGPSEELLQLFVQLPRTLKQLPCLNTFKFLSKRFSNGLLRPHRKPYWRRRNA